jgi:hypothetical protein
MATDASRGTIGVFRTENARLEALLAQRDIVLPLPIDPAILCSRFPGRT